LPTPNTKFTLEAVVD